LQRAYGSVNQAIIVKSVKKRNDIHLNRANRVTRITQIDRGTKPAFQRGRRRTSDVDSRSPALAGEIQRVRNAARADAPGRSQCQQWRGGVLIMIPILAVVTVAAIAFWFVRKDRAEESIMREHYLDVGRDLDQGMMPQRQAKKAA
jgi:hypothetical protein